MSVAEIKNKLHRMIVETDDPDILAQVTVLFASLKGEGDWWDALSDEEKQRIALGATDLEAGKVTSYIKVRERASQILKKP